MIRRKALDDRHWDRHHSGADVFGEALAWGSIRPDEATPSPQQAAQDEIHGAKILEGDGIRSISPPTPEATNANGRSTARRGSMSPPRSVEAATTGDDDRAAASTGHSTPLSGACAMTIPAMNRASGGCRTRTRVAATRREVLIGVPRTSDRMGPAIRRGYRKRLRGRRPRPRSPQPSERCRGTPSPRMMPLRRCDCAHSLRRDPASSARKSRQASRFPSSMGATTTAAAISRPPGSWQLHRRSRAGKHRIAGMVSRQRH